MTTTDAASVRLTLRPYQEEALARVEAAEARGVRRQLGVAATGLGKTVMFCALAERRGGRTLILAHRDELVSQAVAKVQEVWPGVEVGVVKGAADDHDAHVVVASVQTLSRAARLARMQAAGDSLLRPVEPFGLVVVDEAHHAAADTYRRILGALRAGDDDGPLLLGVTATPDRGDGQGLDDLFDEITFSYDIQWGIRAGFLSDLRGKRIMLDTLDLGSVKVSRGDYEAGSAGEALENAGAPDLIVAGWLEHAMGRRTLVFTPTVALAHSVADAFAASGVAAGVVSGHTPLDERRAALRAFSRGELDVMANCAVLTEGYDEPEVSCIVVARPTKSRALYVQMVGRGTRRAPGKADCLVLDVVGATAVHSLVTIPSLFGIDPREYDGERGLAEAAAERDDELVRQGVLRAEDVELFAKVRGEGIAWVQVHEAGAPLRRYVRPLGLGLPTVVLAQRVAGEDVWTAGLSWPPAERGGRPTKQVLLAEVSMEMAQGVAEDYVRKTAVEHMGEGAARLHDAGAAWRSKPPSPRALEAARKWRLKVDPSWNAGQLSEALDRHVALKTGTGR